MWVSFPILFLSLEARDRLTDLTCYYALQISWGCFIYFLPLLMSLTQLKVGWFYMCSSCLGARSIYLSYFVCRFCTAATMLFGLAAWLFPCSQCETSFTLLEGLMSTRHEQGRSRSYWQEWCSICEEWARPHILPVFPCFLPCCIQGFFAFSHPFRTVFSFAFYHYSCLKYRLLGVVVDTEDCGFMILFFLTLICLF